MNPRAIEARLASLGTAARAASNRRFFKTGPGGYGQGDRFLGLTLPVIRRLEREYRDLPIGTLATLLRSRWHEARLLALLILVRQYRRGDAVRRDAIHRLYLRSTRSINNWDLVDASAADIVGAHPRADRGALLTRLASSPSVWERRIAMIATFYDIRHNRFTDALRVARRLLGDDHDLIHKAVGWMLREIGKRDVRVERAFLRGHAHRMPRTALRYAIERFPEKERRAWLAIPRAPRPVSKRNLVLDARRARAAGRR